MSEAIRDMVAFLIQSPGWKPDRFAVQREKVCKRCHAKKNLEKFSDGHLPLTDGWVREV